MDKIVFFVLVGVVFLVPWEENFIIAGLESFARIFGALAFVAGLVVTAITFSVKPVHRALIVLGVFVAWSFASMLWSINSEATEDRSISYLLLLLFAWLIWQYMDSPSRQEWLLWAFTLGTAVAMINMFQAYLRGIDVRSGAAYFRYSASYANPNGMAFSLVLAIVFACHFAVKLIPKSAGFKKLVGWGLILGFILAAGWGVVLTGSRAGTLGLIIAIFGILLTLVIARGSGWILAAIFLLCVVMGIYILPRIVPENLIARIEEGAEAGSMRDRMELMQGGLAKWTERPLEGFGSGTAGLLFQNVIHNTAISVLLENGLIGFVIYAVFWVLLLRAILSLPKNELAFWLVAFAAYSPSIMSSSAEYQKPLWFLCAMVLAQAASLRKRPAPPRTAAIKRTPFRTA